MTDEVLISAAISLGGMVMAFASIKTDTSWIKKSLELHIAADERRFEKITEKLEGLQHEHSQN